MPLGLSLLGQRHKNPLYVAIYTDLPIHFNVAELNKIQRAWPNLNCRTVKGRLAVAPSRPRIAPAQLQLREE